MRIAFLDSYVYHTEKWEKEKTNVRFYTNHITGAV